MVLGSSVAQLAPLLRTLRDTSPADGFEDVERIVCDILDVCSAGPDDFSDECSVDPELPALLAFGREFLNKWEIQVELLHAGNVSSTSATNALGVSRSRHVAFYRSLVTSELRLALASANTRMCQVGCGPMPLSAFMWQKYGHCAVTGIDRQDDAVTSARQALAERIRVDGGSYDAARLAFHCAEGATAVYEGFDVIVLATSIENKRAIFDRILATQRYGDTTIIERRPRGLWRHLAVWEDSQHPALDVQRVLPVGIVELRLLKKRGRSA